jgi:hypothetical protein
VAHRKGEGLARRGDAAEARRDVDVENYTSLASSEIERKDSDLARFNDGDFQKPPPALTCSPPSPDLKFEREDWSLFRTVEGLQQKAGVAKNELFRLVLKELVDNGLDEGAEVRVGSLPNGGYFIEDDAHGIAGTPEEVAQLFSIARPMISTKLLRLPTRGALGNGLRVVAGAVLASQGSLTVITRNHRTVLRPERDGTTTVVSAKAVKFQAGTRVEIRLGPAIPNDGDALFWAKIAVQLADGGKTYSGKTSPWWYDAPQFHELLYASGKTPVRELIAHLDGCTGAKAGEIVAAAKLGRTICSDITVQQAARLLQIARDNAKPVTPERLGEVGPIFDGLAYACARGVTRFGTAEPLAEIPFAIEVWAARSKTERTRLTACVNRTPVTGKISAAREKRDIYVFGCGLSHTIAQTPKDTQFNIWLNITTPYMPITSDGKAPDLNPFYEEICNATQKAVRKAHRPEAKDKLTQKDVVIDNLETVIAEVSGNGEFRFNERQLFYALRPIVMDATGDELKIGNFKNIITDYESEHGEIPGMYREPRGSIYHPHVDETITLGTLMVEDYERPAWVFNKVVYIEKEGFSEALKHARWAERHDCMLMSSKGFSTRAARDLVDKLAEHDEPVTIFCVHDADASGGMIYQTFQEATKARGARKIKIVNLGLEPWEAIAMGLEVETVEAGERCKPVAAYVAAYVCKEEEGDWGKWLQAHRVELNAMTTPQFIEWLDGKLDAYGKLIPPLDVLAAELDERIEKKVRASIADRVLREAGLDRQVATAIAEIEKPTAAALGKGVLQLFEQEPDREWRDYIEEVARTKAGSAT